MDEAGSPYIQHAGSSLMGAVVACILVKKEVIPTNAFSIITIISMLCIGTMLKLSSKEPKSTIEQVARILYSERCKDKADHLSETDRDNNG